MSERPTIGLLGPYGVGNLGDAAIQQSMIDRIRRQIPDAIVYGLSLNPRETESRHGIPAFPIMRMQERRLEQPRPQADGPGRRSVADFLDRFALVRIMRRVIVRVPQECIFLWRSYQRLRGIKVLIISGGGQLDDYWGGAWHHPFTLFKWTALARLTHTTVAFVSVGAGPIDSPLSKLFIRAALHNAAYRSYRDGSSKALIRSIGFRGDGNIYPDLAHGIAVPDSVRHQATDGGTRLVVGVGPMIYFHPQKWPEKNETIYINYLSKLAAFIEWLCANQYSVKLIPGSITADAEAIRDVLTLIDTHTHGTVRDRISVPPIDTVDCLLKEIQSTDIVVTSRFHGVLLSHILDKPVVALSPHMKVDTLLSDMGHSAYCLDINTFSTQDIIDRVVDIQANLASVKHDIAKKEEAYRNSLEEQFRTVFTFLSPDQSTSRS